MGDGFTEIAPQGPPASPATADQVTYGPSIPPQQRILLFSAAEWEGFIEEWAHFALKRHYVKVQRFTAAGDRGIDVAGFADSKKLDGVWDNYQCKRYLGHAVFPSDAWPEIGKIIWHSFNQEYRPPRRYYFVAPHGVGTTLAGYLGNAGKMKKALIDNWDKHVRRAITETQEIALEGALLEYVKAFDFSIFDSKSALDIIEGHRRCPHYATRFGGGLPSRPAAEKPPAAIAPTESRYVAQLLGAYADHKKQSVPDVKMLKAWPKLESHFERQ